MFVEEGKSYVHEFVEGRLYVKVRELCTYCKVGKQKTEESKRYAQGKENMLASFSV